MRINTGSAVPRASGANGLPVAVPLPRWAGPSPEQKQYRAAAAMLAGAVAGLTVAILSGLALVPRVRLVDVLIVIAGAVGGGAALVGAIVQFKQARATVRRDQGGVPGRG